MLKKLGQTRNQGEFMILRYIILSLILVIGLTKTPAALGALSIPTDLSDGEQQSILQILGFGTSFRPVDNPYPMGGYAGFELGLAVESVPTEDIGYYGSKAAVDRDVVYPRVTVGKGIFDSVDLFFSFLPLSENEGVGIYSGALRWGFFQATFVPAVFSVLFSATNTNVNTVFVSQTEGADLVAGVNVDPFSFYVGAGYLYGQGQFDSSLTIDGTQTNQISQTMHTMIGVNLAISEMFASLEIDTYTTTTASLKIGARL